MVYGTMVTIKPNCKRHDAKTAMLLDDGIATNDGDIRYNAIFFLNDGKLVKFRVYKSELTEQNYRLESKEADAITTRWSLQ